MSWRGFYYYDRCMPMGCSSSCKTFEIFSSAIEWIAQNKLHIPHILHLLDDFLLISSSEELCRKQLNTFLLLCGYLGIPMAPEKTVGHGLKLQTFRELAPAFMNLLPTEIPPHLQPLSWHQ